MLTRSLFVLALGAAIFSVAANAEAAAGRPQIMIVGVAHLAAKHDVHNSTWGEDALAPQMQSQIHSVVASLARFKPTKVMIEALASSPKYVERYRAYRAGRYALSSNENDQFGYRLAAMAGLPTVYPIDADASDFPFDYNGLLASAKAHGQQAILSQAEAFEKPFIDREDAMESRNDLIGVLRFLNTPAALDSNAAWYMAADRIGQPPRDYTGATLVSNWYARNLHIFANIMHHVMPGDRVVVFIGQGHAALLDPMVRLSPDVQFVDPQAYLPV